MGGITVHGRPSTVASLKDSPTVKDTWVVRTLVEVWMERLSPCCVISTAGLEAAATAIFLRKTFTPVEHTHKCAKKLKDHLSEIKAIFPTPNFLCLMSMSNFHRNVLQFKQRLHIYAIKIWCPSLNVYTKEIYLFLNIESRHWIHYISFRGNSILSLFELPLAWIIGVEGRCVCRAERLAEGPVSGFVRLITIPWGSEA